MKHFLSFSAGLIITLLISGIGLYILLMSTFTLSLLTLSQNENTEAFYFYTGVIMIVISSAVIYRRYRSGKKYLSLGIAIGSIPLLICGCIAGVIYFKNIFYYHPFNKQKWASSKSKPFNMAKTLAKEKVLIGLSRKEVVNKLGYFKETARTDGQTLIYYTEKGTWDFCIDLDRDTVTKAYLQELGFDD